jgi:hypothetical protein
MNKYPIYIISKGRSESRLTSKVLEKWNVPYKIVIEPQEYNQYTSVIDQKKILKLPFSNLGQGSIPARNWIWQHSIKEGHKRHWIVDDNIHGFYRLNNNHEYKVNPGFMLAAMEGFVDRFVNVPMAGPNYEMFVLRKKENKIFNLNTRIYSCILLSNKPNSVILWRGKYNEDTDLSIRLLKKGYCTILFNIFMIHKMMTMKIKGGNTDELYKQDNKFDGRLEMAKSLQRQHPDIVKITRKWGRWQHQVNYRLFKKNKLILKPGVKIPKDNNEYGMILKESVA